MANINQQPTSKSSLNENSKIDNTELSSSNVSVENSSLSMDGIELILGPVNEQRGSTTNCEESIEEKSSLQVIEDSNTTMNVEAVQNIKDNSGISIDESNVKTIESTETCNVTDIKLAQEIGEKSLSMNSEVTENDNQEGQDETNEEHDAQRHGAQNEAVVDIENKQTAPNESTETGISSLELAIYRADDKYASDGDDEISSSSDSETSVEDIEPSVAPAAPPEEEEEEEEGGPGGKGKRRPGPVRTHGEKGIEDLPPIEELKISVAESVNMLHIGNVSAIIDALVIVRGTPEHSPLDMDSILFLENRKPFARVFETLGPVKMPFYSVRFNSAEEITEKGIELEQKIYYAPEEQEFTSFVFVNHLIRERGSDASWEHNNEPPSKFLDFSDDEAEARARAKGRNRNKKPDEIEGGNAKRGRRGGRIDHNEQQPRPGRKYTDYDHAAEDASHRSDTYGSSYNDFKSQVVQSWPPKSNTGAGGRTYRPPPRPKMLPDGYSSGYTPRHQHRARHPNPGHRMHNTSHPPRGFQAPRAGSFQPQRGLQPSSFQPPRGMQPTSFQPPEESQFQPPEGYQPRMQPPSSQPMGYNSRQPQFSQAPPQFRGNFNQGGVQNANQFNMGPGDGQNIGGIPVSTSGVANIPFSSSGGGQSLFHAPVVSSYNQPQPAQSPGPGFPPNAPQMQNGQTNQLVFTQPPPNVPLNQPGGMAGPPPMTNAQRQPLPVSQAGFPGQVQHGSGNTLQMGDPNLRNMNQLQMGQSMPQSGNHQGPPLVSHSSNMVQQSPPPTAWNQHPGQQPTNLFSTPTQVLSYAQQPPSVHPQMQPQFSTYQMPRAPVNVQPPFGGPPRFGGSRFPQGAVQGIGQPFVGFPQGSVQNIGPPSSPPIMDTRYMCNNGRS